ncbi:hypothetical protein BJ170DRAFT_686205 [Xylariales sp. AK1849]|nr:hypothetical protein BJ170DRAFT_686205 [Xylariales sp. AK1849]
MSRDEVSAFFDANMENVLDDWITIPKKTNLPSNIASSDPYVTTIFQLLDDTINTTKGIRSRLARIQLMRVFQSLEGIIANERRVGRIRGERGKGNTTIANNIYKDAQRGSISENDVKRRKQIAAWCSTIAGPSPLFVVVYLETVATLIKTYRKRNTQTPDFLVSQVLQCVPGKLEPDTMNALVIEAMLQIEVQILPIGIDTPTNLPFSSAGPVSDTKSPSRTPATMERRIHR